MLEMGERRDKWGKGKGKGKGEKRRNELVDSAAFEKGVVDRVTNSGGLWGCAAEGEFDWEMVG